MIREILLLGNPMLYEKSEEIKKEELHHIKEVVDDLHDTLMDFRSKYGVGRAIAAPQIGERKRLVYMFIKRPTIFINPVLTFEDSEMIDVVDDCMSFPNLLVRVKRQKRLVINYKNMEFEHCVLRFEDDLSELLQHECDHLDGVLATMRAIDNRSFFIKNNHTVAKGES